MTGFNFKFLHILDMTVNFCEHIPAYVVSLSPQLFDVLLLSRRDVAQLIHALFEIL
jgi:hypothetical protein